jgi:extracellular factor (EF) 3-hydroxypalmitic acid methyl ester biosynthesis protein
MTRHCPNTETRWPELAEALDVAHDDLQGGCTNRLDTLVEQLDAARRSLPRDDWRTTVEQTIRQHPITRLMHEEPFTRRAFDKPRGYAGDAPMLDLVYGEGPSPDRLTPLGRRLHLWAVQQPACLSVRLRRDFLAKALDDVAREVASPRILALACGHLREAGHSYAVRAGGIDELVGIDQDEESLTEVRRSLDRYPVRAIPGSVRAVLAGKGPAGDFDLIYAAGLYDYLATKTACALTRTLFQSLRPNGRLLIPNFAPSLRDIGYMEAIMDWYLTYRDENAMRELADALPQEEVGSVRTFRDELRNVVYLDVRRV